MLIYNINITISKQSAVKTRKILTALCVENIIISTIVSIAAQLLWPEQGIVCVQLFPFHYLSLVT